MSINNKKTAIEKENHQVSKKMKLSDNNNANQSNENIDNQELIKYYFLKFYFFIIIIIIVETKLL